MRHPLANRLSGLCTSEAAHNLNRRRHFRSHLGQALDALEDGGMLRVRRQDLHSVLFGERDDVGSGGDERLLVGQADVLARRTEGSHTISRLSSTPASTRSGYIEWVQG